MNSNNIHELWLNGPRYCAAGFPISTDSVLLSSFVRIRSGARCVDLGCGAGLLLLLLGKRFPRLSLTGIELDATAADTARQNLTENGLTATILTGDIRAHRTLLPAGRYDMVVSNPPYFPAHSGATATDPARATARSELTCTLPALCQAAAWLCRTGGAFFVVHKPERLSELCVHMSQAGIEPKRLRFVCHRAETPPSLLLLEGQRGARPGLTVLPPLLITNADGSESDEVRRIYHR